MKKRTTWSNISGRRKTSCSLDWTSPPLVTTRHFTPLVIPSSQSNRKEINQRRSTLSNRVSSRADVTKKFAPSAIPSTQSEKLYLKEIPKEQATSNWLSANMIGMWRLRNSTLVSAARIYSQVGARQDDMIAWKRRLSVIRMFSFVCKNSRDQNMYSKRENKIYFLASP